jgi:hypothetical protein
MADQRALYTSISRMASGSQEAAGRRQKKVIFTLVALVLAGAFAVRMMAPATPQNAAPMTETSTH